MYKLDPKAKKQREETRRASPQGRFTELWDSAGLENVEETGREELTAAMNMYRGMEMTFRLKKAPAEAG